MEKENRIKKELARISVYYEDISENQREIITPLLQNAAFMKVTLEDIQEAINESGPTDEYQNGANQHGTKQSAMLQSYNALIKNYSSVIRTLSVMLPVWKKPLPPPVPEKTDAEYRAELRRAVKRTEQINREIAEAAEKQRRQKETNSW